MYPTLHTIIREVLKANEETKVQFILEPLAFTHINDLVKTHGCAFLEQVAYLTRTFAFYMHQEYKKILKMLKDNPQLDTYTLVLSAQPNLSLCGDAYFHHLQHHATSVSQAMPSLARQGMPSQQTDQGLQAEHCQLGLLPGSSSGDPVPSTSLLSTTNVNKHGIARVNHAMVGSEGEVMAGITSDTIPMCVVGQGDGRRGGGVGDVAAVCRPDSIAGASSQQSQSTSPNSADRLAGSLARNRTPQTL